MGKTIDLSDLVKGDLLSGFYYTYVSEFQRFPLSVSDHFILNPLQHPEVL